MKLYFVRHGESVGNAEGWISGQLDPPLTKRGIQQAHDVATQIKQQNIQFKSVFCSTQQRAKSTAQIIVESLDYEVDIEYKDDLQELNVGLYAGKQRSKFLNATTAELMNGGAESHDAFANRVSRAMNHVAKGSQPVLLVSHNGFARCMRMLFDESITASDLDEVPRHENAKLYTFELDI